MRSTLCKCQVCGTVSKIIRRNKLRPIGHRKHMHCWRCNKTTLHIEIYGMSTMRHKDKKINSNSGNHHWQQDVTKELMEQWGC